MKTGVLKQSLKGFVPTSMLPRRGESTAIREPNLIFIHRLLEFQYEPVLWTQKENEHDNRDG